MRLEFGISRRLLPIFVHSIVVRSIQLTACSALDLVGLVRARLGEKVRAAGGCRRVSTTVGNNMQKVGWVRLYMDRAALTSVAIVVVVLVVG